MRIVFVLILSIGTVVACGPSEDCNLSRTPATSELPTAVSITAGSRLTVSLESFAADVPVAVESPPPGWRLDWPDDPRELRARVPYLPGTESLELQVGCGDHRVDHEVLVTVEALGWSQAPVWAPGIDGPSDRQHTTTWIDEENSNRLLLFGGFSEIDGILADLWEMNLLTGEWTQLHPTGAAPMTAGGRIAVWVGRGAVLYHGGFDDSYVMQSTVWRLDYRQGQLAWTELGGGGDNGGSFLGSLAIDEPRNRLISACGYPQSWIAHCDVFVMDLDNPAAGWQSAPIESTSVPDGTAGFAFVHDPETDRLVIFSGATGSATAEVMSTETWALELATSPMAWVQLAVDLQGPPGRRDSATVFDPVGHRMLIFGGTPGLVAIADTWFLDLDRRLEQWRLITSDNAPPARASGTEVGAFDAASGRGFVGLGNGEIGWETDFWALNL